MINIAIVEDELPQAQMLQKYLERFLQESGEAFSCTLYDNAYSYLSQSDGYDIVFMDIMLPGINGMEAAERMRRTNTRTILIFVTNMLNFAVKSYEVDALDYIVKPVSYERVVFKLQKALRLLGSYRSKLIMVKSDGVVRQISSDDIYYVEVIQHKLIYHTMHGNFMENNSLGNLEEQLAPYDFSRCNSCYLVNMKYIKRLDGLIITMSNDDQLKISQPKRKKFMAELTNYFGQGK